jgi:GNAT superfamily N-acetyltransferase
VVTRRLPKRFVPIHDWDMNLVFRTAASSDADTIHRLICELATYEREPDAVLVTPDDIREQLSSANPPFECLIADLAGEAVGFAVYFHNYSTWRGRPGIYLEDLFVLPAYRRRGIGQKLLKRLAQTAVERGCARLEWAVLNWNQPAIDFYETLGAVPLDDWKIFRLTDAALLKMAQLE